MHVCLPKILPLNKYNDINMFVIILCNYNVSEIMSCHVIVMTCTNVIIMTHTALSYSCVRGDTDFSLGFQQMSSF